MSSVKETVTTEHFLKHIAPKAEYSKDHFTLSRFIHRHGTKVQVIAVLGVILGVAALATLPVTSHLVTFPWLVTIKLTGSALIVAGIVAVVVTKVVSVLQVFAKHNEWNPKIFTKDNYVFSINGEDKEIGRVHYHGKVPIITLNILDSTVDKIEAHRLAGRAQGKLLGNVMDELLCNFNRMKPAMRLAGMDVSKPEEIPAVLREIIKQTPPEYIAEMEGVVAGYEEWVIANNKTRTIPTVEDLLIFYLMADRCHFSPESVNQEARKAEKKNRNIMDLPEEQESAVACTVLVDDDAEKGMVFGRNLDWESMGMFGSHSILFQKIRESDGWIVNHLGLPGIVGAFQGGNNHRLRNAMNVAMGQTKTVRGMPAVFFNLYILDNCKNVEEAKDLIANGDYAPLGAYHLTLVDKKEAIIYHMYQNTTQSEDEVYDRETKTYSSGDHLVSEKKEDDYLLEHNFTYRVDDKGNKIRYTDMINKKYDEYKKMDEDDLKDIGLDPKTIYNFHIEDFLWSSIRQWRTIKFMADAKSQISADEMHKDQLIQAALGLPYVGNFETIHSLVMCDDVWNIACDDGYASRSTWKEVPADVLFPLDEQGYVFYE